MQILEALYKALDDYAVDRRGDVGSWVRHEAMYSLKTYIELIVSSTQEVKAEMGADKPEFYERFVA